MRPKTYSGVVERGSGTATKLGFPTVNIPLAEAGVEGIYAATVTVDGVARMAAVFADPKRKLLEAHVLDFSGDLYGKEIRIALYEKIRDSAYFENPEDLSRAIAGDVAKTRVILNGWKERS